MLAGLSGGELHHHGSHRNRPARGELGAEDRTSASWLLTSYFCLLSSVFCLLRILPPPREAARDHKQHQAGTNQHGNLRSQVRDGLIAPEDFGVAVDGPGIDVRS